MLLQHVRVFRLHPNRLLILFISAFNRIRIAGEGTIQPLIEYIRDGNNDIIGRQYCAMSLGNLAAEPENHTEIVKSQGIILIQSLRICSLLLFILFLY